MLGLGIPGIILVITIILTAIILPEGCSLLSNEVGPFMCHTIPLGSGCCTDKLAVNYARIVAVIGIGLTIGSTIFVMRNDPDSSETGPPNLNL